MELIRVTDEIYAASKRLSEAADALFKLGKEKAESERNYRHALAIEMVRLRDEKLPATLIPDVARGNLSDLLFERDLAEVRFKAGIEAVDAIKSQTSSLQTIIKYRSEV